MRTNLERSGPWVGMAGIVVTLFLYGASGLVAPAWAVAALVLVWLVIFLLGCRWFSRHPYRVLVLPLVSAAVWFGAVLGGAVAFGWHA